MTTNRINYFARAVLLAALLMTLSSSHVAAQEATAEQTAAASRGRADINYEVRLHLLVGSNDAGANRLPADLQPIVNQLRASLPFREYALGVTFINRVRDGGNLEVNGVANSLLSAPINSNAATFYNFGLRRVRSETDAQGREGVQVPDFKFGLRVPLQLGAATNYEQIGLTTSVSFRENIPVVIGTLTTNRTDQIMVLVAQIKRADVR